MALDNQGFPSYSFVMFLAFAAFGSYYWSSDPLKTARPLTQNPPAIASSSLKAIPARLWQDPFRVIYVRNKNNKPLAIKKLKKTGLPKDIKQYLSYDKARELLVLGVMVSTEAIADAEERRRRRRYALINALSEAGYIPEDAGHIQVRDMNGWDKKAGRLIMPYEWFKRDAIRPVAGDAGNQDRADTDERSANRQKKILLLWLDASHYHAAPYFHLRQLVQTLATDKNIRRKMRYAILGPAGSGGLYSLVKQADKADVSELCQLQTAGVHILSPLATIADSLLYQNIEPMQWLEQRFSFDNFDADNQCLTFSRTIHSDDQLMFRLVMELSNRGVEVGKNHVVLLSERDTAFGRALPESFAQAFCGCYDVVCKKDYIHVFSYLRGIDGVAPGSKTDLGLITSKSSASKSNNRKPNSGSSIRRPVGSGQFDYLRRVADEIVLLDKKLRKQDGKGILAIGVLGSDVYDKLLILRALHSRLMGVTFFTTDLDAQYLHPAEYPWTRNLLIASSFNLKLRPELQGSTPPFRDSYQTSVFYATSLALQLPSKSSALPAFRDRLELPTRLKPLLFEIGRNAVVPLQPLKEENDHYAQAVCTIRQSTHASPSDMQQMPQSKLHPTAADRELFLPLLLTIAIIGLALLALKQLNARATYQLRWLGAGMLVLAAVSAIGIWCSLTEEPFLLLAGVSVWPTEIINSLTLVLSLYFICASLRALKLNYDEISEKYHLRGWAESLSEKDDDCNANNSTDGGGWKVIFTLMLLVSTVLVALLPRTIRYDDILWMLLIWGGVLGIWSLLINRVIPLASLNQWAAQIKQQHKMPIQQYWRSYGEHGSMRNRFLRALTVVLIFQAFVSLVFTLFGLEPPPLRGDVTRIIDSLITVSSVLGLLFLLFYMVDATRLCVVWMRGLIENSYDWRGSAVEELASQMNIPWPCAVHWLKLQLVAERSGEVSRLIYYPFVVIILILFSRINYFDDWGFPQSLAIITSSLIAIALYAAIKLRQVAEKVRSDFIDYLYQEKITVSGDKPLPDKPNLVQLNELINQVRRLRTGAFQPFLEQPLVKASLLLLGGVGFSVSQFSALL
ncbi:MAG TPA: hypothetical protein ENI98_06630 [Gammaproteobacteria bacterium]|nr:hypothetical protein [Gammaproteobacteria bacterium]